MCKDLNYVNMLEDTSNHESGVFLCLFVNSDDIFINFIIFIFIILFKDAFCILKRRMRSYFIEPKDEG